MSFAEFAFLGGSFGLIILILVTSTLIVAFDWGGDESYKTASIWLQSISIILLLFLFIALFFVLKSKGSNSGISSKDISKITKSIK
jgi:uncharacterized BrkB/YihY/UPF0761 family membrane protein